MSSLFSQIKNPESIAYSAYYDMYYITDAGSGKIYTSSDGVSNFEELTTGLKSPKGILIEFDFYIWVADVTDIVKIDIETGEVLQTIPISGAKFLNDIAVDFSSNLYISDTQNGIIYKYDSIMEEVSEFTDDVVAPNGLYYSFDNDKLYSVPLSQTGNIYETDIETGETSEAFSTTAGMLDGITFNNSMTKAYISSWQTNTVYEINCSFNDFLELEFLEESVLQADMTSPADIYFNTYREELAIPLMNIGQIEIIAFPPSLSTPNDLAYYPVENKLFISNNGTQKILYTELTDNIEDFEYFEFMSFNSIVTSMQIFNDFLYASVQNELYRIDLKTGEIDKKLVSDAFIDDFTVISEDYVYGINAYNMWITFKFDVEEVYYLDDRTYTKICSDYNENYLDGYVYLIDEPDDVYYKLVKISIETGDSVSVSIPKLRYNKIEYYNNNLYLSHDDLDNNDVGIRRYDAETLERQSYTVLQDESYPYGMTFANGFLYYTLPLLNQIKKIDDASKVAYNAEFINLYPNPANETLFTDFENCEYSIYSINGKYMISGKSLDGSIDINELKTGTYFIYIEKSNKIYIQKFIKK
jgi:streptogramin lyase